MPRSAHALAMSRTTSTPLRCPAMRGNPFCMAHRPLPSITMAICCGICIVACIKAEKAEKGATDRSNRQDLFFFFMRQSLNSVHKRIGQLLYIFLRSPLTVFRDFFV